MVGGLAGGGVRLADGRSLAASAVVLCAGAWTGAIAAAFGASALTVEPVRGQLLGLRGLVPAPARVLYAGRHGYAVDGPGRGPPSRLGRLRPAPVHGPERRGVVMDTLPVVPSRHAIDDRPADQRLLPAGEGYTRLEGIMRGLQLTTGLRPPRSRSREHRPVRAKGEVELGPIRLRRWDSQRGRFLSGCEPGLT